VPVSPFATINPRDPLSRQSHYLVKAS
jgi:hypothetical protein